GRRRRCLSRLREYEPLAPQTRLLADGRSERLLPSGRDRKKMRDEVVRGVVRFAAERGCPHDRGGCRSSEPRVNRAAPAVWVSAGWRLPRGGPQVRQAVG